MVHKIIQYFSQCTYNFKRIADDCNSSWKSKGLSNENITAPSAPNNFLNNSLEYLGTKPRVRFSGSSLKQN